MKSDHLLRDEACSPTVFAASTLNYPTNGDIPGTGRRKRPGQPPLHSVPLRSGSAQCGTKRPAAFQLTDRDRQIVDLVFRYRAVRDDHVQVALFSPGAASRCQFRLTQLVRNGYLDRLPRRNVNEPAVYLLSRRSLAGNRLIREQVGEEAFRRQLTRLGSLGHLLAVNDFRVRVERACRNLGWSLRLWQAPEDLAPRLKSASLIPDGYFQVQREVAGQPRTAAFFLELERAGKSSRVLRSKLQRYGDLYYSGRYQEIFGTRALRVLFVFAADRGPNAVQRVEQGSEEAARRGVTIARFAVLSDLTQAASTACLIEPLWRGAVGSSLTALFEEPMERR